MKKETIANLVVVVLLVAIVMLAGNVVRLSNNLYFIFREISSADMPVMSMVSDVQERSANQRVMMERVLRLAGRSDTDSQAEVKRALVEFEKYGRQADQQFVMVEELMNRQKSLVMQMSLIQARNAEGEYAKISKLLSDLRQQHRVFDKLAGDVIKVAAKGDVRRADKAAEKVAKESKRLDTLIDLAQKDISEFTEAALGQAEKTRNAIISYIALFVILTLVVLVGVKRGFF
jgi:hypothetical protein